MKLPFSQSEFFAMFAAYNAAVWPMQLLLVGLAVRGRLDFQFRPSWVSCSGRSARCRSHSSSFPSSGR